MEKLSFFKKGPEFKKTNEASLEDFKNFDNVISDKLLLASNTIDSKSNFSKNLKDTKEAIKKVINFTMTRVLPIYIAYLSAISFTPKPDGKFSERDRAKKEMKKKGITSEQQSVYKLGLSEMLYKGVTPWGYQEYPENENIVGDILSKAEVKNIGALQSFIPNILGRREAGIVDEVSPSANYDPNKESGREDAWRLMLGMPQKNNTFGVSDYRPQKSKEDKYYFKINGFEDVILKNQFERAKKWYPLDKDIKESRNLYINVLKIDLNEEDSTIQKKLFEKTNEEYGSLELWYIIRHEKRPPTNFLEFTEFLEKIGRKLHVRNTEKEGSKIMGSYTISIGKDELGSYVSYYDSWDLDNTIMDLGNKLAKPYEIYDRIYYNPENGEIISTLLSK